MRHNDIVWDEERIKQHEARKVTLAHKAAALVKERAAIAEEKAALEAYEAEYNQWLYLKDMGGISRWIHRDTITEAIKSGRYASRSRRTTLVHGRRKRARSK
jgi:hypothetical protein